MRIVACGVGQPATAEGGSVDLWMASKCDKMDIDQLIVLIGKAIEILGIGILISGAGIASVAFVREWGRAGLDPAYQHYRANLGRGILLGLEFLVIGDIIGTVAIDLTFENLGLLAIIVLIRTFLSFALEIEISGELPWRREPGSGPQEPG